MKGWIYITPNWIISLVMGTGSKCASDAEIETYEEIKQKIKEAS